MISALSSARLAVCLAVAVLSVASGAKALSVPARVLTPLPQTATEEFNPFTLVVVPPPSTIVARTFGRARPPRIPPPILPPSIPPPSIPGPPPPASPFLP